MANDGSITFSVWLDAKEAEHELTNVKKKILDLEAELNRQTNRKTGLEQELKAAAAAAEEAKKRLQELQAEQTRMGAANLAKPGSYSLAELRANAAQISAQQEIVAQAEAAHMAAAAAVEKQNARIEETNQKLEKEKSLYGGVQQMAQAAGDAGEDAANRTSSATIDLSTRLEKTMNRIGGLIKRVFFFSLITRALRGFREFLGKTLATNDEFSDALARLKGALLTAFAPIWNYVIPALTALINFLAKAVEAIAGFISTIFGSTLSESKTAAENLYDEANAIGKVGGAAGKASKQLAKFDEINQLGSSGGGGGGTGSKFGTSFDFSSDALKEQINDKVAGLLLITGELLLAVGFITAFTGRIGLGVGLIAAGAAILGTANEMNPEGLKKALEGPIGKILFITAELLLVVGFICAFTGKIALGVGLIAAGAAILGTAKKLNPGALASALNGPIAKVLVITSELLLVAGFICAFTGKIALGCGLITAGATVLGTGKALNSSALAEALNGPIAKVLLISGELLLVAGFIVAFTGNIALGIGLIAAGASVLGTGAVINKDALAEALNGPIAKVLVVGGELLLVAGFIVAFTGHIALGVGLIAAGASVLGSGAFINKDALAEVLNGPIGKVLVITGELLLVAGFITAFTGHIALGIGLIAAGASVLGSIKLLSPDSLREILSGQIGSALVLGSELLILVGIILLFTGNIPLGLGLLIAGAGILGSIAALDSSILLDKLKEQWAAITNWWNTSIAPIFTADWWSSKFSAIGAGMKSALNIVIGAVESAINWIVDKVNLISIDIPPVFGASGVHLGFNLPHVAIPRLAQGAVIPPNREFLAVLGDQPRGTNIEAPLDTIVAAFRQVMRETGGGGRTLVLELNGQQFGQIVLDAYNTESQRIGVQLGGAT